MFTNFVTMTWILFSSYNLFAHGMNKPGPHNGYIRMPGAFHTELVEDQNQFKVFLLDMNFMKLTLIDSKVSLILKGKQDTKLNCRLMNEYFACQKPKGGLIGMQEILIKTTLKNSSEKVATYKLPLEYK